MNSREQDIRVEILNTLLTTPHRALQKIYPVHRELIGKDPRFYVRRVEAKADALQGHKALDEDAGADQQDECQRHLRDHEHAASAIGAPAAGVAA